MKSIHIKTLVVTPFQQNCRIIIDEAKNIGVIIDPGGEIEKVLEAVGDTSIEAIWLTHSHIDHVAGLSKLLESIPVPVYGHKGEKEMRNRIADQAQMFGLNPNEYQNAPEPSNYIDEGDRLMLGDLSAKVLFTPGHAPGHLCFYFDEANVKETWIGHNIEEKFTAPVLVAGDTLFRNSIGRTDLPGSVHEDLINSIKSKIFSLSDETVVLSGHGPNTTVGYEKQTNPFLID